MCASRVETVESVNKLISFIADGNKYFHVPLTASDSFGCLSYFNKVEYDLSVNAHCSPE